MYKHDERMPGNELGGITSMNVKSKYLMAFGINRRTCRDYADSSKMYSLVLSVYPYCQLLPNDEHCHCRNFNFNYLFDSLGMRKSHPILYSTLPPPND